MVIGSNQNNRILKFKIPKFKTKNLFYVPRILLLILLEQTTFNIEHWTVEVILCTRKVTYVITNIKMSKNSTKCNADESTSQNSDKWMYLKTLREACSGM